MPSNKNSLISNALNDQCAGIISFSTLKFYFSKSELVKILLITLVINYYYNYYVTNQLVNFACGFFSI